jgi:regulator of protease activity HflC (stomatin/prohibitin superfamily)
MERAVAVKKLAKILGKTLGYRVDVNAPDAEQRAAAQAKLAEAISVRDQARQKRDERYKALLADQEYQDLVAAHKAAQKIADKLSFQAHHHYKFTVGTSNGMFFHVRAQGDSWEEVIEKLTTKGGTAAD